MPWSQASSSIKQHQEIPYQDNTPQSDEDHNGSDTEIDDEEGYCEDDDMDQMVDDLLACKEAITVAHAKIGELQELVHATRALVGIGLARPAAPTPDSASQSRAHASLQ